MPQPRKASLNTAAAVNQISLAFNLLNLALGKHKIPVINQVLPVVYVCP